MSICWAFHYKLSFYLTEEKVGRGTAGMQTLSDRPHEAHSNSAISYLQMASGRISSLPGAGTSRAFAMLVENCALGMEFHRIFISFIFYILLNTS